MLYLRKNLLYLRASINLMPLAMLKKDGCSAIIKKSLSLKSKDPRSFNILVAIGALSVEDFIVFEG